MGRETELQHKSLTFEIKSFQSTWTEQEEGKELISLYACS